MSQIIESSQARGFVTIDSIVRSALMDIGAGMERYEVFRHWCLEGYKDFNFDLAQEVKTVVLDLTAWKAVSLPLDYVDFVLIGVIVDNKIRVFTHDDRISLYRPDGDEDGITDPIVTTASPDVPADVPFYFWNVVNSQGEDAGQLYGLTVKHNGQGYYKFNTERREIQFSPAVDGNTKIYLEYISDGVNPNAQTVVNVYAAKLLKLYIHWSRLKFSKSANQAQIQRAMDDYNKELFKVQNRIQKITVEDVLETMRDAYALVKTV